ncbi:MAG TPA: hypothetical protein DCO75_06265 [Fibrobacteres bacterium]|nr:hypothetical protein [Fibrobacterota bacterium]
MLLSIVIPTHNRYSGLKSCLEALLASGCNGAEIFVVDDNSQHDIAEKNKTLCETSGIGYHYSLKNQGAAATRNYGIGISKGEWIAFIDDDVCVESGWRRNCDKILAGLSSDVVGVEGRVVAEGNGVWDNEVKNLSGGLYLSCNIIYKRSILDTIGRFDENFSSKFPSCEDHELAVRALFHGNIIFAPSLCARHLPRKINLVKYVMNSFYRIKSQLYSESYFYLKHRDRYHTLRYATTFWGTYKNVIFRYTFSEIKRRRFSVLFLHPLQSAALLLSSIIEQLYAILLLPGFILKYINLPSLFFIRHIDENRTKNFWKINADVPISIFVLKPEFLRSLLFPLIKKPVYSNEIFFKKIQKTSLHKDLNIFLRIDDVFFDELETVDLMCDKLSDKNVHYCAAVTGNDLISPGAGPVLQKILSSGGRIALHGFTHSGKFGMFNSEILQMNFIELDVKIKEVFSNMPANFKPEIFIPPFNAISREQILHLSDFFKVICGGPETARFTDYYTGPIALCNKSWYFPAFQPFYGCAYNILKSKTLKTIMRQKGFVCFNLHMPDEAKDNFASLIKLIDAISDYLTSWNIFFNGKQD